MYEVRARGVLALLGVGALVLGWARVSWAAPTASSYTSYWSDATYSQQVGERYVSCYVPYIQQSGQITAYARLEWSEPCDPSFPD
jgi:hypothetical protein